MVEDRGWRSVKTFKAETLSRILEGIGKVYEWQTSQFLHFSERQLQGNRCAEQVYTRGKADIEPS